MGERTTVVAVDAQKHSATARAVLTACKEFAKIDRTQETAGDVKITAVVEVKAGRQAMGSNMREYHLLEGKLMEQFPNVSFDFRYTQTDDLGSHRDGYLC